MSITKTDLEKLLTALKKDPDADEHLTGAIEKMVSGLPEKTTIGESIKTFGNNLTEAIDTSPVDIAKGAKRLLSALGTGVKAGYTSVKQELR